jgi:hypothetical protein
MGQGEEVNFYTCCPVFTCDRYLWSRFDIMDHTGIHVFCV